MPKVSIGMPVLNGERYIRKALDSLLNQTFSDFELFISDNASTDATAEICKKYATQDKRIRYFRQETNIGAIANFQFVLNKARAEYFMWAAADDYWHPAFIAKLLDCLEANSDCAVAMCAVERILEDGSQLDIVSHLGEKNPNRMNRMQLAWSLTQMQPYHLYIYGLHKTAFLQAAFEFPAVIGGDELFVSRLALATRFGYVDEVLHIRLHNGRHGERYRHEAIGRIWNDRWAYEKRILAATPYLLRSQVIPYRYKPLIPLITVGYLWQYVRSRYINRVKAYLKKRLFNSKHIAT